AIAGADELEDDFVADARALDHARDERAAETLEARAVATGSRAHDRDVVAVLLGRDVQRQIESELALRTLDADGLARDRERDALRHGDRALADAGETLWFRLRFHHHTSQRSSPPTLRRRASLSVIRPCDVLRIE